MRRAIPGLTNPIAAFAIVAGMLFLAGLIACFDSKTTSPDRGVLIEQRPPGVVPDTTSPALPFVVDTGATPGGWLAVAHSGPANSISIFLVRLDGSEAVQLTRDHWDYSPDWSPDGQWIAFGRYNGATDGEIWVIRPDGSGERRVAARGNWPSWLDDGRVGYDCGRDQCAVGVDGSNPVTVVAHVDSKDLIDYGHIFSPDGKRVAFVRATHDPVLRDWGNPRIYVAKRDGSDARPVTTSPSDTSREGSPRWSKNGTQIAFRSTFYGIAVADADGGRVHGVSRGVTKLGMPDWSADGTRIVFGTTGKEFYIANADGTGTIRRVRTTLPEWADEGWSGTWAWAPR